MFRKFAAVLIAASLLTAPLVTSGSALAANKTPAATEQTVKSAKPVKHVHIKRHRVHKHKIVVKHIKKHVRHVRHVKPHSKKPAKTAARVTGKVAPRAN
jgi:hypothetical protein